MNASLTVLTGLNSPLRLAFAVAGCLLLLAGVEGRSQPPGAGEAGTARGKVVRFTTAPMGETDGAVLDDGTTLHWPPHLQGRFADLLRKGDRVRAAGRTETGPEGDTHFEVRRVTNLRTGETAENQDFDRDLPSPPPGRDAARRRVPDREQRLRELAEQVDHLRQEIQNLRREK